MEKRASSHWSFTENCSSCNLNFLDGRGMPILSFAQHTIQCILCSIKQINLQKPKSKMDSCSNMMAIILDEIVRKTDQFCKQKLTNDKLTKYYNSNYFVSLNKPRMDIKSYMHRLAKYLHVSESCFILALIYIDRLTEKHPRILVNSYTIHRLCFTSVILAMKFNDDAWFSNAYNATVSGVEKEELLYLEINFLKLIDFQLMVDPQTFKNYYNHLVEISGCKAVLSNCSCHDPTHSYKIYNRMIENRNENRMNNNKGHENELESTKSGTQFSQISENSTSSYDSNSKKNLSSNSSQKHLRRDSFVDKNKIMEEELEIASNQVNLGCKSSFNPKNKEKVTNSLQNKMVEGSRNCHDSAHIVKKSLSNVSVSFKSPYNSFVVDSEYPTCKHERYNKPGVDHFEHHRVSY